MYKVWMMEVKDNKYEEELKVTKTTKDQDESFEAVFRSVERKVKRKLMIKVYEEVTIIMKEVKVDMEAIKKILTSVGKFSFSFIIL